MAAIAHGAHWAKVLDAIPLVVLVVDADGQIHDANAAALSLLGSSKDRVLRRRGGDVLHCIHSFDSPEGCGRGRACRDCVVRNSVRACFAGGTVTRRRAKLEMLAGGETKPLELLVTANRLDGEEGLVVLVLEDISELTTLREIIPICSHCRRVRDDQEYWQSVEAYFKAQVGLDFSHGLCPECTERHYPQYAPKSAAAAGPGK